MTEGDLLTRIAQTLRNEIGPAVAEEYPKTQAFMASVVAQKLGRQIDLASQHAAAQAEDLEILVSELVRQGIEKSPAAVVAAFEQLRNERNDAAISALIEALYRDREALGEAMFSALLGNIRAGLRKVLNRRMEYAA